MDDMFLTREKLVCWIMRRTEEIGGYAEPALHRLSGIGCRWWISNPFASVDDSPRICDLFDDNGNVTDEAYEILKKCHEYGGDRRNRT